MKLNKKIIAALGACIMLAPCATALNANSMQTVQAAKSPNRYKKLPHYVVYIKTLGKGLNGVNKGLNSVKAGTVLDTTGYNIDYFYGKTKDWYMYADELAQDTKFIRIPKNATKGFKSYKAAVRYSKKHFPKYWYNLKHHILSDTELKQLWLMTGANNLMSFKDFKGTRNGKKDLKNSESNSNSTDYTDDNSSVEEDW